MSLIVGQYYRGDPKQKPKQWGPSSVVRDTIFNNADNMGLPHPALATGWSNRDIVLGDPAAGTFGTPVISKNALLINSSTLIASAAEIPDFSAKTDDWTLIGSFEILSYITDAFFFGFGSSISSSTRYIGVSAWYSGLQFNAGNLESYIPSIAGVNAIGNEVFACAMFAGDTKKLIATINGGEINYQYGTAARVDADWAYIKPYSIGGRLYTPAGLLGKSYSDMLLHYHYMFKQALTDDQVYQIKDNPYALIQPPTFRTYFDLAESGITLVTNNIAQNQTIDNLDLIQQAILSINSIDQSQTIDNITLSLSQNLIIAGISQSQIIDNISLLQQISLLINSLQQNQVIDANDLIQQSLLSIQELSQSQVIDNLTLLSAVILTIAELNQAQQIDNLDLLQQSSITIADTAQSQLLDNIVLLYGDVLAITGISQGQTSDNISLVQQNLLSVADINQVQTTDTVTISVDGLLEIANLVQTQNLDVVNLQQNFALAIDSLFQTQDVNNIILDSSQILAIQQLVQTQLVDVISLVQQSVLNVDEISQQQILDNIEIVITRISGKLSITFQLKTPGGRFTLR